jgi:undecaprenyl-diphosphatase
MSFIKSIILGLVQGLTEFLPVSSSGHLAIFQELLGTEEEVSDIFFTSLLHLGTLLAVCFVYRKTLGDLLKTLFSSIGPLFKGEIKWKKGLPTENAARRKGILIIYALLPMFLILPIKDFVENIYSSTLLVGIALLITSLFLFLCDRFACGKKNEETMTVKDSLIIGFTQLFAVLPGISRSGSTITAGLACGLDRSFAAEFSFIMSVPTILASFLFQVIEMIVDGVSVSAELIPVYIAGVVTSAVSGFFAIKLLQMLLKTKKFVIFSVYCLLMGILAIVLSIVK